VPLGSSGRAVEGHSGALAHPRRYSLSSVLGQNRGSDQRTPAHVSYLRPGYGSAVAMTHDLIQIRSFSGDDLDAIVEFSLRA
jgi:hypothetical protein